jgi:hypothetical protein
VPRAAAADAPQVTGLHYDGRGCPDPGSVTGSLTDHGNGQFVYGLVLAQLGSATVLPSTAIENTDCAVTVDLVPPRGYQMRIAAVMLQGRHDAPSAQTTTSVYTSYRMSYPDGEGPAQMEFQIETNHPLARPDLCNGLRVTGAEGIGEGLGNWTLAVDTNDRNWSPCNTPVSLDGVISALARSDDGQTDAEIAVQRADLSTAPGLAWGWQFRRCGGGMPSASFDGHWSSTYAGGGQTVPAELAIAGTGGTFRTSSFSGRFFDLSRDGGDLVGSWSALGQQGWLRFTLSADGRSFSGRYGFAGGEEAAGVWSGHR